MIYKEWFTSNYDFAKGHNDQKIPCLWKNWQIYVTNEENLGLLQMFSFFKVF